MNKLIVESVVIWLSLFQNWMHLLYFVWSWNETDPPYTGGKKFDIIGTSIFGMPLFDMHVMNMHATNEVGYSFELDYWSFLLEYLNYWHLYN